VIGLPTGLLARCHSKAAEREWERDGTSSPSMNGKLSSEARALPTPVLPEAVGPMTTQIQRCWRAEGTRAVSAEFAERTSLAVGAESDMARIGMVQ
jgi:hypothetical protein